MSDGHDAVVGVEKIVDNGAAVARWNLLLLAEGYREEELDQFAEDAADVVDTLLATSPFDELQDAINVYRVDVASAESGATDPLVECDDDDEDCEECQGSGAEPDTVFGATFCTGGLERLLTVDVDVVFKVADAAVPEWHVAMVMVNSTKYGGSGAANVPVFSLAPQTHELALHELGHSGFALADEYPYRIGCDADEPDQQEYDGSEPIEPNVTARSDRAHIKWNELIDDATPVPTTENDDCTECDDQPNPVEADTIGLFEGARYFRCGMYRPAFNCRMRQLGQPFCEVCTARIRTVLRPHLRDLVLSTTGRVERLRVHREIGYGPPHDHVRVHVVAQLDARPDHAFGFPLRDGDDRPVHTEWVDLLRTACRTGRRVRIESTYTGGHNEVVRHLQLLS